jgi:peptide/nickel transport system substrate-binding protein
MSEKPTQESSSQEMTRRRFVVYSSQALVATSVGGLFGGRIASAADAAANNFMASSAKLVMGYPSVPSQFDPTQYSGADIIYIDGVIYPTPMRFKTRDLGKGFPEVDPRNPVVEPWLAKSLESTADLKTWKLTLGKDVKSAAGNPLSAKDVRFTVQRNLAIPGNGQVIVNAAGIKAPSNVKILDDMTVEFRLPEGNRLFPQLAQNQFGFGLIDSTEALKHATKADPYAAKWLARNTAGFGAYTVSQITPQRVHLVRNPGYKLEPVGFASVDWLAVPNSGSRLTLLKSGSLQIVSELEPVQIKALTHDGSVHLYSTTAAAPADQLNFNIDVPGLRDPRVRQALMYAIPTQGILSAVYQGQAQAPTTIIGGTEYQGADPSLYPFHTQNLTKAKELLAAAGVKGLTVEVDYDITSFWQKDVSIQLQAAWNEIGVKTNLVGLTPAVWGERLGKKQLQTFFFTLTWFVPDFFYVMKLLYASNSAVNSTGFKNKQADALIAAGLKEPSSAKRNQIAAQFQKIFYQNPATIPIAVRPIVTAISKPIQGYTAWTNAMVYWPGLKE